MRWRLPCPRPSCHAVILEGERILLVERGHEPYRGYWGMPGGAVELGETVAEALRREVLEETGLDVEVGALVTYRDAVARRTDGSYAYHYVIMYHLARVTGGILRAGDDAARAAWVPLADLPSFRLVPGLAQVLGEALALLAAGAGPGPAPSGSWPAGGPPLAFSRESVSKDGSMNGGS